MSMPSNDAMLEQLKNVIDPEVGLNIVDMGLIYELTPNEAEKIVHVRMTLTTQGCPMSGYITSEVESNLKLMANIENVEIELIWEPAWSPNKINPEALETLRNGKAY